jgi:hypothetical protein
LRGGIVKAVAVAVNVNVNARANDITTTKKLCRR